MKSSKLISTFQYGNMVIPLFFIRNYRKWNLELNEFIFLMYLYHLGNKVLFDPGRYQEDLNMELPEIMELVGALTDKAFIKVEVVKNDKGVMEEVVLLDDFYEKVSLLMMEEVNEENNNQVDNSSIFELIEKEFGRTLSPIEYEIIKSWLEHQMSEELIREAVKEATFNGVSNLRYIDKILYEWGKAGIHTVQDVEAMRKKRNKKEEKDNDVDLNIVDWNWFDEDE